MSAASREPTVVSLFAGCGGLDIGFSELGYDLVYACDNDPAAMGVYARNIDERAYVRDVTDEAFHSDVRSLQRCDVVLGGFPCQGFSKAGPKKIDDVRNSLYREMLKTVDELKPKLFLAENVDGISQNFKGAYLQAIIADFREIGYDVEYRLLDSVSFGVPQHRRRIFFVGTRKGHQASEFIWPQFTNFSVGRNGESVIHRDNGLFGSVELARPVTIRDAIGDICSLSSCIPDHYIVSKWDPGWEKIFEKIGAGQKLCNVRHSDTSVYTWNIPEYFGAVDEVEVHILETIGKHRRHKKYGLVPNGNPLSCETIEELTGLANLRSRLECLLDKGYLKLVGDKFDLKGAMFCSGLFKRPLWDAPAPTVLTNFYNPRYFLHPSEKRPFSLREAARLQGFPDQFLFTTDAQPKEIISGYRLVGNAVSPPVGRAFAKAIREYLDKDLLHETPSRLAYS